MKLIGVLEHLDKDFLCRILSRLTVLQESEGEVVDPSAVPVENFSSRGEVTCLNESHQLLIVQVLHLPLVSLVRRQHARKVSGPSWRHPLPCGIKQQRPGGFHSQARA